METMLAKLKKQYLSNAFKRWAIAASVMILAAFFISSWVETRVEERTLEHDALLISLLEQYSPESVQDAVTQLSDGIEAERVDDGRRILNAYGYKGDPEQVAVRTIFTIFMVIMMILRGFLWSFNIRKLFKRSKQFMLRRRQREAGAPQHDVELTTALSDLSEQLDMPLERLELLTDSALPQRINADQYKHLLDKLLPQIAKLNTIADTLITVSAADK